MADSVLVDILAHIRAVELTLTYVGGYMPPDPDAVNVIMAPDPGLENLETMGTSIGTITLERPIVQIRCRAGQHEFLTATQNAWLIYRAIHNTINATINGTRYLMIEAIQTPYTLGSDENGRWIVGFNLQITKEDNA